MRIFDLAFKDLSQILRDIKSLLFLAIMPIAFTFFMGFAYRGAAQPPDPRLALGWIDDDPDGLLGTQLHAILQGSDTIRLVETGLDDPQALVRKGNVAGVLIVPSGFSQKVLAGQAAQLELIVDELSTTGQSLYQLLSVPVTRLISAVQIAHLDVELIDAQKPFVNDQARQAERLAALTLAVESWNETARNGSGVQVEKGIAQEAGSSLGGNPYNQASPGILVQFAIFGLVTSAQILVQERKTRTLQRLITTAMRPWQIIAGHLLAMFTLGLLQMALLIAFGQWVLGVDYLREPAGTLLVTVALGLWVASMGLLIGVVAKGEEQVVLFSLIAMFIFTSLGGAWFPLEGTGQAFAAVGQVTPAAWAMDGFQNILIRKLSLQSTLLPGAVLLAYAVGFFAVAVWRFRASQER